MVSSCSNNSKWWHQPSLEMRKQGKSSRQIAKDLFGKSSMKSSVNYFFNKWDAENKVTKETSKVKVLIWDIETLPCISAHWGQYNQNLSQVMKIRETQMLSHAWQWYGTDEIHSSILTKEEILNSDDERLVLEMWKLFDNADVIIAHNGKKFDVKKANAAFLKYNMTPPSPYKVIDTLQIARKMFNLQFKSLDYLCQYLNVGIGKVKHSGMDLWMRCLNGDAEALSEMEIYNRGDIPTLLAVYERLRVWDNNSVNMATIANDRTLCPTCTSPSVVSTGNFVYTSSKGYDVYKCECGALSKMVGKGLSLI